jgi:hypothetical protein
MEPLLIVLAFGAVMLGFGIAITRIRK